MYKHILFAVEFTKSARLAAQKAVELAKLSNAKLSFIHIAEVPTYDAFPDIPDKEVRYAKLAQETLSKWGQEFGVPESQQYLETGSPKIKIVEIAAKLDADLIIVGHHEREGIYRLLGSNAYAVLNNTKCDVLTISYKPYKL